MSTKESAQELLKKVALQPGDRYRHYKGGEYEVITCAVDEATLDLVVVYYNVTHGSVWTRTLENWNEVVEVTGERVKRFIRLEA